MKGIVLYVCILFSLPSPAQMATADNQPPEVTTRVTIPADAWLFGVFEGRSPCTEIASQLNVTKGPECIKMKWRLILYKDAHTHQPTTYTLYGTFSSEPRTGKWTITRGMSDNPGAIVYQLHLDKPHKPFYLLKGDDNVLFILDEKKNFRVGNADFSYTLNRVKLIPAKQ